MHRQDRHRHAKRASRTSQLSPLLFDLTSLQREANARFGFSARNTLGARAGTVRTAQGPDVSAHRCARVAGGLSDTVRSTLALLSGTDRAKGKSGRKQPDRERLARRLMPHSRAEILAKKLGPAEQAHLRQLARSRTTSPSFRRSQLPKSLSEPEQKLYDLVIRRFLAVFYPAAESLQTTRITTVDEHHFKSEGKVLQKPGWLAVYGNEAQGEDARLVPVQRGEHPSVAELEAVRRADPSARALLRSDAALGDGGRRQARRRRRVACSDGRQGARHSGHPSRRSSKA